MLIHPPPTSATIIGMMSGTSVDSIDAALCELAVDPAGRISASLTEFYEHPISEELRERIFRLFSDPAGALALACSLNFEIGAAFADAARELLARTGRSSDDIDAVASHGQTVCHIPPHAARAGEAVASTLQIGEASVIAEALRIPVISDFRVADMAAGGNGAPLVPFADWHLFSRPDRTVVLQNIGGIANCTVLPAGGGLADVVAFDTGPGNMIIDALTKRLVGEAFDRDGAHAARGTVFEPLLAEWMAHPYIVMVPPKTTGRELFGEQFARQVADSRKDAAPDDLIATATAFTARSIAQAIAHHAAPGGRVDDLYLAGGGALNPTLTAMLKAELERAMPQSCPHVALLDETGHGAKARECTAFALLGFARLLGMPANVPSATGARHPALLGKFTTPSPVFPADRADEPTAS